MEPCSTEDVPPTLASLPTELLTDALANALKGSDLLSLGFCCGALTALLSCEPLWQRKLVDEFGFTDAGLALWCSSQRERNRRFVVAYHYFAIKHEALEFSLLREPIVREEMSPARRDIDLVLCIEVANPWPVDV